MLKRAGYDKHEGVKDGSLVVKCPACPRPGENLPERWEEDENAYIFPLCFSLLRANLMKIGSCSMQDSCQVTATSTSKDDPTDL
jgi:hypothetical protein